MFGDSEIKISINFVLNMVVVIDQSFAPTSFDKASNEI
jgi:hypothetical protein